MKTNPLICYANQWTGFCLIGISIMKDSRRSSSTYTESLFLHVVKHNLLLFFSIWHFFHEYTRFTGGGYLFIPFLSLPPLHRHLNISWVIAAESSSLSIAGSRNRTWNLWYTLFRIHYFYT